MATHTINESTMKAFLNSIEDIPQRVGEAILRECVDDFIYNQEEQKFTFTFEVNKLDLKIVNMDRWIVKVWLTEENEDGLAEFTFMRGQIEQAIPWLLYNWRWMEQPTWSVLYHRSAPLCGLDYPRAMGTEYYTKGAWIHVNHQEGQA